MLISKSKKCTTTKWKLNNPIHVQFRQTGFGCVSGNVCSNLHCGDHCGLSLSHISMTIDLDWSRRGSVPCPFLVHQKTGQSYTGFEKTQPCLVAPRRCTRFCSEDTSFKVVTHSRWDLQCDTTTVLRHVYDGGNPVGRRRSTRGFDSLQENPIPRKTREPANLDLLW